MEKLEFVSDGENVEKRSTDANGIARVPITKHGWQHIIVDYTVPNSSNALAAREVVSSALVFELRR